jgi:hypothetical protein
MPKENKLPTGPGVAFLSATWPCWLCWSSLVCNASLCGAFWRGPSRGDLFVGLLENPLDKVKKVWYAGTGSKWNRFQHSL